MLRAADQVTVGHLHRNRTFQDIIVTKVDRAKAPSAQDLLNAVSADL